MNLTPTDGARWGKRACWQSVLKMVKKTEAANESIKNENRKRKKKKSKYGASSY